MPTKAEMDAVHDIGLFDAHCHPTDIIAATPRISKMKARALTIMATRAQDQHLVEQTAREYAINNRDDISDKARHANRHFVVPSFGWHPWFAHQLYDDRDGKPDVDQRDHYRSVLTPTVKDEDDDFLDSLPKPRPLSVLLNEIEQRLLKFPLALVGEIGLDRSFRVPYGPFQSPEDSESSTNKPDLSRKTGKPEKDAYTPGSREGRPLTPYRVSLDHQKLILKAQLELAATNSRAVSIHSVATHGAVFDVLSELWKDHLKPSKSAQKRAQRDAAQAKNHHPDSGDDDDGNGREDPTPATGTSARPPYPPRICLHSYSGPLPSLSQFLNPRVPAEIFFSFSELVNFGSHNSEKAVDVVKNVPKESVLIESDLHCAGDEMDRLLVDVFWRVCGIRGWEGVEGAEVLRANWMDFVFGRVEGRGE